MSRFTAINLSGLTPLDVIETLDFEAIVTEMRDDLVARFQAIAGVIDLESEHARKLIEAFAYREMLLRARINDAARSVLLASAYGSNLDHLAALFATQRMQIEDATDVLVAEDDDRLRRRVKLAPDAFSVAGPEGAYVYHALTAAPWAPDATAIMTTPGRVRITMLRVGAEQVPSLAEREAVRSFICAGRYLPQVRQATANSDQALPDGTCCGAILPTAGVACSIPSMYFTQAPFLRAKIQHNKAIVVRHCASNLSFKFDRTQSWHVLIGANECHAGGGESWQISPPAWLQHKAA